MKRRQLHMRAGRGLLALGGLHTLAMVVEGGPFLWAMCAQGLWQTASNHPDADWLQVAVFWSFLFGLMLLLVGWLLVRLGRGRIALSMPWTLCFTGLCLFGAIAVPVGGFWLGIVLGIVVCFHLKKGATPVIGPVAMGRKGGFAWNSDGTTDHVPADGHGEEETTEALFCHYVTEH